MSVRNSRIIIGLAALTTLVATTFVTLDAPAQADPTRQGGLSVASMTADGGTNPLGVEVAKPRLTWVLRSRIRGDVQRAYEVSVADSASALHSDGHDVWDSGVVRSTASSVDYAGPALQSSTRYYWTVRVWDGQGHASAWSTPAWWEMGLLNTAAWSGAQWIGGNNGPSDAPRWPAGTVATASSTHADSSSGGSFAPSTAIDNDPRTFWNDDTYGQFPDWLQVTAPSPVTLAGVTLVTHPVGGAEDFTVATLDNGAWSTQATVTGDTAVTRYVPFAAPVSTTAVRITVTRDWGGGYTRIAEVYPDGLPFPAAQYTPPAYPPSPLLRKDFTVARHVARARVYVSGLGYYVLSVDGNRVGNRVLDPGFTVYNKTALYSAYDVTSALRDQGAHAIGVTLGRGFFGLYRQDTKYWSGAPWLSNPKLLLKLEIDYTDGSHDTIVSNNSWQTHDGPTTSDSIYMGETYDARLAQPGWNRAGFDASSWPQATIVSAPTANLRSERMDPIRVIDTMQAEQITNPKPGTYVFKFPVMTAGWARLRVQGSTGTEVSLRYGERLRADGTVNNDGDPGLTIGPIQTDRYILSADPGVQTWEPSFSYKGFQYIQVDGYPGVPTAQDVVARVVHTDVHSTGTFTSSNALLNTIHANTRRTLLNNMHSILTDSPMFEKRGWLDDADILGPTTTDNFDMLTFYRNWLTSMVDNQGANGAGVRLSPDDVGAGYNDPEWAGALVLVPWQVYQDYGDRDILATNFDSMAAYVDYLATQAQGNIQRGVYGDWASPSPVLSYSPPEGPQLTATAYYYKETLAVAQAAQALGRSADAARFTTLAANIKDAFNAKFLDTATGTYHTDRAVGYRQASNAVPLTFGLVPPEYVDKVTANLVADVQARGNHLNTGDAGTKELLPALTENGHVDTAFAIATQRSFPSWGYQIDNGATTLWESWGTNTRSRNHAFEGTIDDWFYRDLAGIKPAAPGYSAIAIHPYVPAGLDHAGASEQTPHGTVASSWRKSGHAFHLDVTIPANTTATVHVPLFGDRRASAPSRGAKLLRTEGGDAIYSVGSGHWRFISHNPPVADTVIDAPSGTQIVPPSGSATVRFTVRNYTNTTIRVRPAATASAGYAASTPGGAISIPANGSATAAVQVSAIPNAPAGTVTLRVGDSSASTPVTRTDDWARLATMTASSSNGAHLPATTNDGNTNSGDWDSNQGWNDGTIRAFPDTLTATWTNPVTLTKAVVYSLDSATYPAAQFGLRDYQVQAQVNGQWQTLATVTGNTAGMITSTFSPVTTTALRLSITDSNDHLYSRVIELEAFGPG